MKGSENGLMRWLTVAWVFSTLGIAVFGQETGVIRGKITDPEGAPLPGVEVQAVHQSLQTKNTAISNNAGVYRLPALQPGEYEVIASLEGFKTVRRAVSLRAGKEERVDFSMNLGVLMEEVTVVTGRVPTVDTKSTAVAYSISRGGQRFNTEEYASIQENRWNNARGTPLSTFSIDVDTASYANLRRFITDGQWPPADAVRIEEMINYFDYDYPKPEGDDPFAVAARLAPCPWAKTHRLLHIGLQGRRLADDKLPPANLVFLIDVSGSMYEPNKLPLLQASFRLLVEQLRPVDRVAIVVYAGAAGLVLPSTPGENKEMILGRIDEMEAGGSTAGGAGIQLAYRTAEENLIKGGNNRVILATDGDFNIGVSDTGSLVRLIEEKKQRGIHLTVLGFGKGNIKDSRLEQLADKGDGNYHYIDSLLEGKKVLVDEMHGTLFTVARDVKIQVEFNPARVKSYRLIGYENRMLAAEDFNDDQKDAGEIGSGHRVTALYEIIPAGSKEEIPEVDELRYQSTKDKPGTADSPEWATVKLRYKPPREEESRLLVRPVTDRQAVADENLLWAAAVAEFGLLLRDSKFKGSSSFDGVLTLARQAKGQDRFGYRSEFIRLVEATRLLKKGN